MVNKKYRRYQAGIILLTIGVLAGIMLVAAITWADLEAFLFRYGLDSKNRIQNLACPVVIGSDEVGQIKLTLKNPDKEDEISRFVRVYISDGYYTLTRHYKGQFFLDPGGEEQISWDIYPEQAVYNRLILFRVYVHGHHPYPPMDGNCGVLVVDFLGLNGRQMFGGVLAFSLLGIITGGGLLLWRPMPRMHPLYSIRSALLGLTVLFGLGFLASMAGLWLLSVLLLMASFFLIINLILQLLR